MHIARSDNGVARRLERFICCRVLRYTMNGASTYAKRVDAFVIPAFAGMTVGGGYVALGEALVRPSDPERGRDYDSHENVFEVGACVRLFAAS